MAEGFSYEEAAAPPQQGFSYEEAMTTPQPEPEDTSPSFMTGLMNRVKDGFTQDPNSTRNKMRAGVETQLRTGLSNYPGDVADVFMEGVHQTVEAATGNGKSQFDELRGRVEDQLIAVGRTPEQAKGETDRLVEGWKRQERMGGAIFGPITAVTAPIFGGPMRSFISRPIEEQTGFPKEATEGYINVAAAAAGMRSLARVTVDRAGNVRVQAIGDLPKAEDFTRSAELIQKGPTEAPAIEQNLRTLWEERGVHPAEAVHDAQNDSWLRNELTKPVDAPLVPDPTIAVAMQQPERLVAATVTADGRVFIGHNHAYAIEEARKAIPGYKPGFDPIHLGNTPTGGFITSYGRVVSREEAYNLVNGEKAIPGGRATAERQTGLRDPENKELAARWQGKAPDEIAAEFGAEKKPQPGGSDVTRDPPLVSPSVEPLPPAGSLATAFQTAGEKLLDIWGDIQMKVAPMAARTATPEARVAAKDFQNNMRRNRWELEREVADIEKRFNPEQRKRMWDAADEESVARQLGESTEHQGLVTLEPSERLQVDVLHARAQNAWLRAGDLGMVEGEGLPAYTPRMVINTANALSDQKALPLNSIGKNLKTTSPNLRHREHMTAEETEAAAKAKYGAQAELARDIRALPLATAKLEDAIAGRTLMNKIRELGRAAGDETIAEGAIPSGSEHKWFTLDHPAFKTWRPKIERLADGTTAAVKDSAGNLVFEQVPLYVRGDFEGPLRAVLDHKSGAAYQGLMELKGKTMSVIMYTPMIHNMVEFGRAFPALGPRIFKAYFDGNRAKNDPMIMREAIDNGLVPIGKRFFKQDIDSIMESPDISPGRSWTAKIAAFVPGLFDEGAGVAVKRAIDKAGDFWHNTLLWDRIADLQMGIYTNLRGDMVRKGVDPQTSSIMAAHFANRYAGALPQEAMSSGATKIANMLLFSRTFTMGNLGVMKDMFGGLPKDLMAQIEAKVGVVNPEAVGYAKSLARRKAMMTVAADVVALYAGNSVLQSALNVMLGDKTIDEEAHGYARRFKEQLNRIEMHPMSLLQPFDILENLGATGDNEPGKKDRLKIGYASDGSAIYARNPVGKIGEEFIGFATNPLDMLRRKEGTIARPIMQVISNDKGFGRKVYDPHAETPFENAAVIWAIVEHIAKAQTPEGQINAFSDLVRGEGDPKVTTLQTLGPLAGVTFSKGAPGGPAVGEMYSARAKHDFQVNMALPDIRRQILRGDEIGARDRMRELGIPNSLANFYVKTTINPSTRLSGRALMNFGRYATPEQRERMERARE